MLFIKEHRGFLRYHHDISNEGFLLTNAMANVDTEIIGLLVIEIIVRTCVT